MFLCLTSIPGVTLRNMQNVSQACIFWHVLPWHSWQMMACMVKQQGLDWAEVSRRRGRERDALSGSNEGGDRQLWGDKGLCLPTAQRHHSAELSHTFHFACFRAIYTQRQIGHGNNAQQELFYNKGSGIHKSPLYFFQWMNKYINIIQISYRVWQYATCREKKILLLYKTWPKGTHPGKLRHNAWPPYGWVCLMKGSSYRGREANESGSTKQACAFSIKGKKVRELMNQTPWGHKGNFLVIIGHIRNDIHVPQCSVMNKRILLKPTHVYPLNYMKM